MFVTNFSASQHLKNVHSISPHILLNKKSYKSIKKKSLHLENADSLTYRKFQSFGL